MYSYISGIHFTILNWNPFDAKNHLSRFDIKFLYYFYHLDLKKSLFLQYVICTSCFVRYIFIYIYKRLYKSRDSLKFKKRMKSGCFPTFCISNSKSTKNRKLCFIKNIEHKICFLVSKERFKNFVKRV